MGLNRYRCGFGGFIATTLDRESRIQAGMSVKTAGYTLHVGVRIHSLSWLASLPLSIDHFEFAGQLHLLWQTIAQLPQRPHLKHVDEKGGCMKLSTTRSVDFTVDRK